MRALLVAILSVSGCGAGSSTLIVLPDGKCQQTTASGQNVGAPFACPKNPQVPVRS